MSPSRREREREYARRRYEKWQAKQVERAERAKRAKRNGLIAGGAAVAVVAVVVVVLSLTGGKSSSSVQAGASSSASSPAASASASATASPSASATAAPAGDPCPVPKVKPPASPLSFPSAPSPSTVAGKTVSVTFTTSCGDIVATLDAAKAPRAVASTVFLAQRNFWNGSPCHRLTTQGIFVLQCGDPTGTGSGGPGYSYGPVENAPKGDLYKAGTIAMARQGSNGNSMGSQFFLVYKDSPIPSDSAGGYTVLGQVTTGEDIVEKIAAGGVNGGSTDGAPARPISIVSVTATVR